MYLSKVVFSFPPYFLGKDIPSHPFEPSLLLKLGFAEKTHPSAAGSNSLLIKASDINFRTSLRRLDSSFVSEINGKLNFDIYKTYLVNYSLVS